MVVETKEKDKGVSHAERGTQKRGTVPEGDCPQHPEPNDKPQVSKKLQELLSAIEGMTVLELASLVKALEEKFGVSASVPIAVTGGGAGQAAGAEAKPAAEEKTSFTVVLANSGDQKIQVIKEIRTITNLGLKEAKDLVEGAPKTIREGVAKAEAEEMKKKLEAVGAKIELT